MNRLRYRMAIFFLWLAIRLHPDVREGLRGMADVTEKSTRFKVAMQKAQDEKRKNGDERR